MRHTLKVFTEIVIAKIEKEIGRELDSKEQSEVTDRSLDFWVDNDSTEYSAEFLRNVMRLPKQQKLGEETQNK